MIQECEKNEVREIARRALDWLKSAEGEQALKESREQVANTAALLERSREIDPRKLHEPFTV